MHHPHNRCRNGFTPGTVSIVRTDNGARTGWYMSEGIGALRSDLALISPFVSPFVASLPFSYPEIWFP
jgi:hypothetical protein